MSDPMPQREGTPQLDAEHPWPGLFPYGENAHAYFHGRERETADLLRLVRRDTFSLLYGQSGLGKSSLLRAGLFPRLRDEGFLPIYLRLDFRTRAIGLREQAWNIVRAALAEARIDARAPRDDEPFWAWFHATDFELWDSANRMRLPVLVFDQFEELVQASEEAELLPRLHGFLDELGDLVENRVPPSVTAQLEADPELVAQFDFQAHRFHCVLGFREDFLADLEQWMTQHGLSTQSRLRITRMQEDQALAAVAKTGGALIERDVAERIVRFVSAQAGAAGKRSLEIEPALLSVVCFELNNRRLAQGAKQISADLLTGAQEQIISEFYERSVADLGDDVQAFIERELLTESGYRDSCAVEDAVQRHGMAPQALQALVDRRVLRQEERFGVLRVELTHDVLTPVVRARRDQRMARAQREAEREREQKRIRRLRVWLGVGSAAGALAVTLVVVFYQLFREAEHEKERVIEAQSTLFLSRANVSLENNVPAEPVQYLAQAVTLHPGNAGAIARLATYAGQRRFARKLWEREFGQVTDGSGPVVPIGADAWAFGAANGPWRSAGVEGGGLREGCPAGAGAPWATALLEAREPAPAQGLARVADAEWLLRSKDGDEARAAFQRACEVAAGRAQASAGAAGSGSPAGAASGPPRPATVKTVEPGTGALWLARGGDIVRVASTGPGEALPDVAEAGAITRVFVAHGGAAAVVVGDALAALYARNGATYARSAVVARADPQTLAVPGPVAATFSSDGAHAWLALQGGRCELWDVRAGRRLWTRPCTADAAVFATKQPWLVATGPGERSGTQAIEVLDVATGQRLGAVQQALPANHLALSPDEAHVAVAGQDRSARVYRLPALAAEGGVLLHEGAVVETQFVPGEGSRLLTASFDGAARLWDWNAGRLVLEPLLHPGPVLFARSVANGDVLTLGDDRRLRLWRVAAPQQAGLAGAAGLEAAVASADGTRLAYVRRPGEGKDPGGGAEVVVASLAATPQREPLVQSRTLRVANKGPVSALAFDPAGERLAVLGSGPWLAVARVGDGTIERTLDLAAPATRALFVPGTRLLLAVLADDTLRVLDLAQGRQAGVPFRVDPPLLDLGVSADGRWISVATAAQLSIVDLATGYPVLRLAPGGVFAAAVHPRRAEIAYASRKGLTFWRPALDEATLRRVLAQRSNAADKGPSTADPAASEAVQLPLKKLLVGVRYTPAGDVLAGFSIDGLVTTWNTTTLAQGPQLRHSSAVTGIGLSGDGRWLTTTTLDAQARIWDHRTGQLMADPTLLADSEREFRLPGRGTWALVQDGASPPTHALRFVGLGFDDAAPAWFVPTVAAITGNGSGAPASPPSATASSPRTDAAQASPWWEAWLRFVAARSGAGLR